MSAAERLADWIVERREEGFASGALESAEIYVIDWLASALAGRGTEPGRIVLDYARSQPLGPCGIAGEREGRSAEIAALVNGALSHMVEMDDVDRESVIHPGAVVIPAALAVAEREESAGREFLASIIAGYEIAIRFGKAVGRKHYYHFHNTSTCGVFGAAAAAGWLLGLDRDALVWALGNAGTMASGLWEFNTGGAMSKHLHTGHAASSGLRAAELAALGFTGASTVVEGPRGFFAGLAPEGDPHRVTAGLGEDALRLPSVSLKPHASCRHTHAAIDAALELRGRLDGRTVSRAVVHTYGAALDLCDNPAPRSPYEAKFSLQYCVSRALTAGSAGLDDFAPEDVSRISTPVDVTLDERLDAEFPARFPARVTVGLDDGATLEAEVQSPLGDPENPLTRERVEQKLHQLAGYGDVKPAAMQPFVEWATTLLDAASIATPRTD